ncbi:MAG: tetratricopeptide repeat protein [Burkholderiales bacterium]|nr:tetratricopeptide repeat protein [Burkholderiales bacterium]
MELAQPVSVVAPDTAYAAALKAALQAFHAQQPAAMENHCAAALALRPESAHAQQLMGVALHLLGRHAEALPWMDRASLTQPVSTELLINRGEVLRSLQRWADAEQAFEQALTQSPGNTEALNNLGLVLQARGRFDAAETRYRAALAERADHVEALNNLGTLCQETRRPTEAEACYRQVLAQRPGHRNALNNLATIAKEAGRVDEAHSLYRQVLADSPDFWRSWNSLGQLAKDQGDYDEAIACYRRSLAIAPGNADTLYNIALLELLFGDRLDDNGEPLLAQGFAHYEVRYDGRSQNKSAPKPPELGCPMWRGEPLAGKHIALVREQGLGDQLQFCRYAALVRALGAEVTLIVDGPLVELMQTLDGPTRVIAPGQQRDYIYDYWAFQLSLPHRLRTTLDTIPAPTPYLRADAAARASWRRRFDALGAGPKVGIVWAGNPEHANNRNRSMDLADLAPVLAVPGVHFVSLQKGAAAVQELRTSPWAEHILDLDADLNSYADTAAVLAELDLLISVDTSVIHLAGALNRPCWALLAHGPDWRWMRGHEHTPWYPSVRLMRQPAPRDWTSVAQDVSNALVATLSRPSASDCAAQAVALLNQAMSAIRAGREAEGETCCRRALALQDSVDAWHLLALSLKRQQQLEPAAAAFAAALQRCGDAPFRATVLANLGHLERSRGDEAAAQACYELALALREAQVAAGQAVSGNDELAELRVQLGNALAAQGRTAEAEACWRRGLDLAPGSPGLLNALAAQSQKQGRPAEAEKLYRDALIDDPASAPVLYNLAGVLNDSGRLTDAITQYQAALAVDPGYVNALTSLLRVQQSACLWGDGDTASSPTANAQATALRVREVVAGEPRQPVFPFAFLAIEASRAEQRRCAQQWVQMQYRPQLELARRLKFDHALGPRRSPADLGGNTRRLRIGYLSSDLHNHATAYLIAEVFERHDRRLVETFAYSCAPDDGREMRPRLRAALEHFVDVVDLPPEQLARRIHADSIDILVDLKGYTRDTRSQVLALRPAPVQVNWLGYPGTLGDAFADYVLGDPIVTPVEHAADYDEHIAQMPHCYQPNDRQRRIASMPSRASLGLPDDALVLCCFNHTYKITPTVFARWVSVLQALPDAVLWLLKSNSLAEANLRQRLADVGLPPERLIFAAEAPLAEHLGRLQQADLLLDTEPYNAHTTSSDALWAGVPVLTRTGDTFPSRVATSLVTAAGLPELAVRTGEAYVALAIELGRDRPRLAALKQQLLQQRLHSPLFDSERFTRDLEALYQRMWARAEHRLPPEPLLAQTRDLTAETTSTPQPAIDTPENTAHLKPAVPVGASALDTPPTAPAMTTAELASTSAASLPSSTAPDNYHELLIGCGGNHAKKLALGGRSEWHHLTTLDINPHHHPDLVWDLTQLPLPFEPNSFDEIHAYEVLEHTGAQGDYKFFFAQFAEFWRILKPGGVLIGTCPSRLSPWAWGDPSHTRVIQPEHFIFLDQRQYIAQVGKTAMSDFRWIFKDDFSVVHAKDDGQLLQFALRAVKPSRIPAAYL